MYQHENSRETAKNSLILSDCRSLQVRTMKLFAHNFSLKWAQFQCSFTRNLIFYPESLIFYTWRDLQSENINDFLGTFESSRLCKNFHAVLVQLNFLGFLR